MTMIALNANSGVNPSRFELFILRLRILAEKARLRAADRRAYRRLLNGAPERLDDIGLTCADLRRAMKR